MYEDGQPGEIFITMSKEGSTISGLMDSFATAISIALQYGVPLRGLVDKFSHMRFEPSGFTKNPDIPMAKSIMDYIFRWLASKFLDNEAQQEVGIVQRQEHGRRACIRKKLSRWAPTCRAAARPWPASAASPASINKTRHPVRTAARS